MRLRIMRGPPPLSVRPSWRDLYASGAFAQRELWSEASFRSAARERGVDLGMGRKPFEHLDERGALRPVAFATQGYFSGATVPAEPPETMVFREEVETRPWGDYAWDAHGVAHVSALYSPWQLLYLDDVLEGASTDLPLNILLADATKREQAVASIVDLLRAQEERWRTLDELWRPLLKILVRL